MEDCQHCIESKALEKWMNQNDEEIVLKKCLLCNMPILKTQRFMNQVKVILNDISIIKRKQFGSVAVKAVLAKKKKISNELKSLSRKLKLSFPVDFCVTDSIQFHQMMNLWDKYCEPLLQYNNKKKYSSITTKNIESLEFVIDLINSILKYRIRVFNLKGSQMKRTISNNFIWLLSVAFKNAQDLSNQQKCDINMEMARSARIMSLYEIMSNTEYKMKIKMSTNLATELVDLVGNIEALLISCQRYSLGRDEEIQVYIELICQKLDGISIVTEEEKKMIHAAMSTSFHSSSRAQGHWGKCCNGHIYCVTECGGPMQVSVCPECKVTIGGQNHVHVPGVSVATEMDGARNLMYQS